MKSRLLQRNQDNKEAVEKRMGKFKEEISHWNEYDYVVVNDDLENCYKTILQIIESEKKGSTKTQNKTEIENKIKELLK